MIIFFFESSCALECSTEFLQLFLGRNFYVNGTLACDSSPSRCFLVLSSHPDRHIHPSERAQIKIRLDNVIVRISVNTQTAS